MENELKLASGAMVALGVATAALVVMPYLQVRDVPPPAKLQPYTDAQLRGREVYVANGCVYCHSQQPRDRALGPDQQRGWGRASVPGDYVYDKPHLLGSMRTGPDLFNIGARQPSKDWHLGHLYQPRAYVRRTRSCRPTPSCSRRRTPARRARGRTAPVAAAGPRPRRGQGGRSPARGAGPREIPAGAGPHLPGAASGAIT